MNRFCVSTRTHPMKTTSVSVSHKPVLRWYPGRPAAVCRPPARVVQAALLGLAMSLAAPSLLAQATPAVPERMTYQGFLTDGNGVALGNTAPKNYDIIFRIYNHESNGGAALLWAELQTVTVDKGYFSVLLGEGSAVGEPRPPLSTLFRGPTASERWVGITVRGLGPGGANVDILPRLRMLPGPYAFLAQQANKLVQENGTDLLVSSGNQLMLSGGLRVAGNNVFELGAGLSKQTDAGKIGYAIFTPGALDIVGAGTNPTGSDRAIKFWTEGGATFVGPVSATSFSGNGAGLTGLNASQITAGVLPDNRLSGNVARRNEPNIFSENNQINGHLRVGDIGNFALGSPGYGRALVFSGGPDLSGTWNNDNSDPLWIARYNVAQNQTELRINIGDDPGGSDDRLVVGTTTGSADFTLSGTWTPVMTVTANGRLELRGALSAFGGLQETFDWGLRLRDNDDRNRYVDFWRHANGFSFYTVGYTHHTTANREVLYDGDNNWDFYSDRRLKKDIEDAEPMLERALKIPVRRYRWKDEDESAKRKLGVIAQEVQPLFPDLVGQHTDREGGDPVLTVGYSDFGLIAIKALQELAAQHESEAAGLRERLKKQEEQLAAQARELEALGSQMTALRPVVQDLVTARAAESPVPTRATALAGAAPEP